MHIIFIAWIYVVLMMSLTESSLTAGVITFLAYCVLPLAIIHYITNGKQRKQRKHQNQQKFKQAQQTQQEQSKKPQPPI